MTTTNPDLVERLRKAVTNGMDNAGTLPAPKSVKVKPEDWHELTGAASKAAARIEELEQALEWQLIATAPKDGTVVLALTMEAQNPSPRVSWWEGDGWVMVWKPEKFVMPGPARWWPTHWQHLPKPPALGAS